MPHQGCVWGERAGEQPAVLHDTESGLCHYSSVPAHPDFTALYCTIHYAKKLNISNLAEKQSHIRLIIFLNCTTLESQ